VSTLGTQRTRVTRLSMPERGQWRADITLEAGAIPTGTQTLTIGTLAATGRIDPALAGYDAPDLPHVVLVGGLGWDAAVTRSAAQSLSMFSDAGVRLSSVLNALALAAGESIAQPTDRTIAFHWSAVSTRDGEAVRYRDVLANMVRLGYLATWRVDLDGVTRFTARATSAVVGRATYLRGNRSVGLRVFGCDDPAEYLPGNIVEGSAIGRAVVVDSPESLTVECWDPSAPTLRDMVIRIIANAFPALVYGYPRTYIVAAVNADDTLDLVPPPTSGYLRDLRSVPQWNTGGLIVTPELGAEVVVVFRDADETRPVVQSWAPGVPVELAADASDLVAVGESASAVELAGGGPAVVRVGDAVAAGYLAQDTARGVYWRETLLDAWAPLPPGTGPGNAPVSGDVGLPVVGAATAGSTVVTSG
jgi:hypothetical protein